MGGGPATEVAKGLGKGIGKLPESAPSTFAAVFVVLAMIFALWLNGSQNEKRHAEKDAMIRDIAEQAIAAQKQIASDSREWSRESAAVLRENTRALDRVNMTLDVLQRSDGRGIQFHQPKDSP